MSLNHAVVWIDHREAHVLHFGLDASETEIIRSDSKHPHLHHHRGTLGSGNAPSDETYFHHVVESVSDAKEILIVGPGSAKLKLIKHIQRHDPTMMGKIEGVETIDHPTDPQLLAFARKYFIKVDALLGNSSI